MPINEKDDPKRAKLLNESEAPKCTKSNTDIAAPRRAKVLNDMDDPKWTKSSTENALPMRE
jgi:hypothetical protein